MVKTVDVSKQAGRVHTACVYKQHAMWILALYKSMLEVKQGRVNMMVKSTPYYLNMMEMALCELNAPKQPWYVQISSVL